MQHPVFQDFKEKCDIRLERQCQVVEISNRLQRALGLTEEDIEFLKEENGVLNVVDWDIIACDRYFGDGITVLEIVEAGSKGVPGFTCQPTWLDPLWMQGLRTTNIPPDDVVEMVVELLDATREKCDE